MSIDFCNPSCQTVTTWKRFGIYDAEDKKPAIITVYDEQLWNAIVINKRSIEIVFTAIDNCITIVRDNGEMESSCDGMLTYENTLLLIELKNKRGSWQYEGLSQIESTIKKMKIEQPDLYNSFKKKKAIIANRKHKKPLFQETNFEQREYFWNNYKARIQFEAEIIIP